MDWRQKIKGEAESYMKSRADLNKSTSLDNTRGNIGDRRIAAGLSPYPNNISFNKYKRQYSNFKYFLANYCKNTHFAKDVLFKMHVANIYFGSQSVDITNYISSFEQCKRTKQEDIIYFNEYFEPVNLRLTTKHLISKKKIGYKTANVPFYLKLMRGTGYEN